MKLKEAINSEDVVKLEDDANLLYDQTENLINSFKKLSTKIEI